MLAIVPPGLAPLLPTQTSSLPLLWTVKGRSWDTPSRPRTDKHPTEDKQAWGWGAWPSEEIATKEQA